MQMKREMQNGCPNQASLKWPISQRQERMHGGKEEEKREKKQHFLKRKEARHVSKQRDKGWIGVIHGHDTTHLALTTWQDNRRS